MSREKRTETRTHGDLDESFEIDCMSLNKK